MNGESTSFLTNWPVYNLTTQNYLRLVADKTSFPVESRFIANRMHFWNSLVPVLASQCSVDCDACGKDGVTGAGHLVTAALFSTCIVFLAHKMMITIM